MRVCWEASDGYVGGSRPQWTDIPDEELAECSSLEEQQDLIWECIDDDFRNLIQPVRVEINDDPLPPLAEEETED